MTRLFRHQAKQGARHPTTSERGMALLESEHPMEGAELADAN